MPVKSLIIVLLLLGGLLRPVLAAELATLFTTPEERALIDRNRYRSDQAEPVQQTEVVEDVAGLQGEPTSYESVTLEYVISGITVSHSGPDTVWINSVAYEDGARLDDGSRIKIFDGNEVRVRITAPDGKQYYATSGETLEISILKPAEPKP